MSAQQHTFDEYDTTPDADTIHPHETQYPFHTTTKNGETVAGVLFVTGTGEFYEFQPPDTHNDYARFHNPRTGDTITYTNVLDESIKKVTGGHIRALLPADEWDEFRTKYVNADDGHVEQWRDQWNAFNHLDTTEPVHNTAEP